MYGGTERLSNMLQSTQHRYETYSLWLLTTSLYSMPHVGRAPPPPRTQKDPLGGDTISTKDPGRKQSLSGLEFREERGSAGRGFLEQRESLA